MTLSSLDPSRDSPLRTILDSIEADSVFQFHEASKMRRRTLLKCVGILPALRVAGLGTALAGSKEIREFQERMAQKRAEALARFPFERIEVRGAQAFEEWERLTAARRGVPVIIGGDESLETMAEPFGTAYWTTRAEPVASEVLAKASKLSHPESLYAHRRDEHAKFERMKAGDSESGRRIREFEARLKAIGMWRDPDAGPPVGEWPVEPPEFLGLTVDLDWQTGRPFETVYILFAPIDDWTELPAHLRWGNWNANPPPEIHVAALRSWRDRYGAELVGLSNDVMNIRVTRKPQTREEALSLAREHYEYCNDIVDQGVGSLSNLAAALMAHDWWYFWWD